MKKIFLILFTILAINLLPAQNMRIGIIGGYNYSSLMCGNITSMSPNLNTATTYAPSFGASCLFKSSDEMGISINLLYSQINQKYNGTQVIPSGISETMNSETKLSYIDVPILFRYYTPIAVYFEIGPQLSILAAAAEDRSWSPYLVTQPNQNGVDYKTDFNGFNCEAVVGTGYTYHATKFLYIDIGLRAGYGLFDVTNELTKSDWSTTAGQVQHSVTSTVANFTKFDFTSGTYNYKYASTNRFFAGMMITICYLFDNPLMPDTNGTRSGAGF